MPLSLLVGSTLHLQTTFYVVGIIFMSVSLLLVFVIAVVLLMIKARINAAHKAIVDRVQMARKAASYMGVLLGALRFFMKR
jgi:hypothetical protein